MAMVSWCDVAEQKLLAAHFMVELLVHGKAPQIDAPAFDAFFFINFKALVVKERPRCNAGMSKNSRAAG